MTTDKGVYMYLTDPARLRKWMSYRGYSYAELGRAVGVSKQFVHQLAHSDRPGGKRTCKPGTARLMEKFLLPPKDQQAPDQDPLFVARHSETVGVTSETVGGQADTSGM